IRYQGGNNAGHTVELPGKQYKLHLIPSGILYPEKPCIIGNGVVVDVASLLSEMHSLEQQGFSMKNLFLSDRAHVVMPYHKLLDTLSEKTSAIGTTGRGIGPCYVDKMNRTGIRICDLLDKEAFPHILRRVLEQKNTLIQAVYGEKPLSYDKMLQEYRGYAEMIRPLTRDTSLMINELYDKGCNLLFEGAQGTMLDVDHGTYPYVTSSSPISGGACIGAGVGPRMINNVMGVAKAYTTRVGNGPMVTELLDETGNTLREKGREYGTTTGRPRRCGWFDVVVVKYAVRISGMTALAISRMDTLGGFAKVRICTGYELNGRLIENFPPEISVLQRCKPVYEEMDGWDSDIAHVREFKKLPDAAQNYLKRIEKLCNASVAMVGVGARREECVTIMDLFG
ncbi:MAG: adenylosuccinate synthase, partial [Bacillota bacterium]|nr:adenylosuccinate synthase [Bacillota bacterium]